MGDEELEKKAQIVREICDASTLFTSCSHLRSSTRRIRFVDWYLILRVDEDSGSDVIRRRYRQLALQIHPDKNKHPKAELAFKLISEAYECLSDKARRRSFNSERRSSYCKDCCKKSQPSINPQKTHKDAQQTKHRKTLRAFKEVQNRLKEECRVIENCLRVTGWARGGESPLFDPTDRLHFPDYPHFRDRGYFGNPACSSEHRRTGRCESPVYQIREERRRDWSKSSGFRY